MRQRVSSEVKDSDRRRSFSKICSEDFLGTGSGLFKGQTIGSDTNHHTATRVFNYDDINKRAIQLLHSESSSSLRSRPSNTWWFQHIFHPYDRSRRFFDFATVIWVLLLVFLIPIEIGFDWFDIPDWQKLIYIILDFWFAIDIILNFRTGYINHGTVVMDPGKISQNYLSTWFLVDAIGTFPFERLLSGDIASRKTLKLTKYFKIPKLLRVSRLMKYVRNLNYVYDFSKVLVFIFTTLHLGACIWVLVLDPCEEGTTNYTRDKVCAQENPYRIYAEALHLSAAMFLGVSNEHIVVKPEFLSLNFERKSQHNTIIHLVSTLFMVIGLFLIALLISEANVYVMGKKQGSAAFQSKTDRVNHEMEYYCVPHDLQDQVRAFYDYVWIHQRQYDDKIALLSDQQMSTDLQRKLALHLFKDVVSHISFFSEIDDLLLGEICMSLRTRIFLPRDMIILKGDVGKELFIIAKGIVEVLRDDLPANLRQNAPEILLQNGSFFGEIALVMEVRRTCSVQARTVCEVNVLQQAAFDSVLKQNPHFARKINELVVARQLDSSLARSNVKGVDFQVSQSDLDQAMAVMEKNMKEGLERRQSKNQVSSTSFVEPSHLTYDTVTKVRPAVRVSFDEGILKQNSTDSGHRPTEDEESQTELPARYPKTSITSVSNVIRDITRRSTRFADEEAPKRVHKVDRPLSTGFESTITLDTYVDTCSDTEVDASKNRSNKYIQRRSTGFPKSDKVTEDELEGHFKPGISFDIAKIRPVILNSPADEVDLENERQSLNSRISHQGKMIEQLLSKIDQLENQTKEVLRKS